MKFIKGLIEVFFLIILFLTLFLTMPFVLEAIEKDAIVGINYLAMICFLFYIVYISLKSSKDKVRNSSEVSK